MFSRDMYNQDHNKGIGAPPMSPRISFSNDFVESSRSHSHSHSHSRAPAYRDAPVSSDFEFSVSNYSMMSADELFFNGRLLPLKEGCSSSGKTTTLRDELQIDEDEDEDEEERSGSFSLRPPKNPTRWRGFLGLRKSHIGSKKVSEKSIEKRGSSFHHNEVHCTKSSQSQEFVD